METSASECTTLTNIVQPEVINSGLRGANRPNEDEGNYHLSAKYRPCSGSFPKYMVSIRNFENDGNFGHKHFCGGVIIRSDLVLTAAHCFIKNRDLFGISSIRVVAGTPFRLRRTAETQVIKVRKIIIHEMFLNLGTADIALLKLRNHIKLNSSCAALLNLPEQNINDSTVCSVLGWGKLYFNGPLANEILQLNVTLHSKEFCEPYFLGNNKSNLCASDRMDGEKSPCVGDSGGPLICQGVLTGIVSYGFQCNYGLPTVYTDVYAHRDWIKKNNVDTMKFFNVIFMSFTIVATIL